MKKQQKNDRHSPSLLHFIKQTKQFKIIIRLLLEDDYALSSCSIEKPIEKDREFQRTMKE
ncbi:hypothetical protein HMPREF9999_00132 [Alloprevotella sp. oral taxon 473 str. F0040]|nr:hypothetical protein HMPREF9999_00132 [Alloprevotella sp. oral taxon 473 str. F0040]